MISIYPLHKVELRMFKNLLEQRDHKVLLRMYAVVVYVLCGCAPTLLSTLPGYVDWSIKWIKSVEIRGCLVNEAGQ